MKKPRCTFLTLILLFPVCAFAQPQPPVGSGSRYDRNFFIQLRGVFGRFRDSDLERVFDKAQAIQCSELVNDDGEWRTVAFFNEKRELGDWYRRNFDEVKNDLAVFIFKGVCRSDRGLVQLTTKFPVSESIEAYNQQRITLDQVAVNTNNPVRVGFNAQTQAYSFDLPYLFLISQQDNQNLYSLEPPRLPDRYKYAMDVVDHWDCKSVAAENVTYHFLICRTTTLPRNPIERSQSRPAFGASAYFILSDGKEASSSVKLSFNDAPDANHAIADESVSIPPPPQPPAEWTIPEPEEKILDIVRDEFRIRFAPQTWTGRISKSQVLSAKRISSLDSAMPAAGADYCIWLSNTANSEHLLSSPDATIIYDISVHDNSGQSAASIRFHMKTPEGLDLGSLECFFPRAASAAGIPFSRWASIVGDHLLLEVRP
jgi:hypothetical protein